ncbi:MAG: hypothetical protein CM1200mP30_10580 [Pseudomonadota bacterium]|nr:MAG: hypothetical protein CM1200mP30_10580 [Pseudomonadota bacterium]
MEWMLAKENRVLIDENIRKIKQLNGSNLVNQIVL